MSLMERDYIRERYNEKNNPTNKKWSSGFGSKKSLESELDRICEDKRKQKEYKKQLFNRNIKPHIVYKNQIYIFLIMKKKQSSNYKNNLRIGI